LIDRFAFAAQFDFDESLKKHLSPVIMPDEPYLLHLTTRLAEGLSRLPEGFRNRHSTYLAKCQNPDGGFSGREGGSDLYYTGFGLRGLAVLNALTPEISARAAGFLRPSLTRQASVVDFFSLLYSCALVQLGGGPDVLAGSPADWPERVVATLETFRTPDGGYGKSVGDRAGSTYHTFLVALCYQLLGRNLSDVDKLRAFINSRRREDGGFVEVAPMKRSGTNPTAAAVGILQILLATPEQFLVDTLRVLPFLTGMASPEGGLRANGRAPLADLLSTFTGAWTLSQLNALDQIDLQALRSYVQSLELSGGGFRAGLWDNRTDVEYTFYGLGVMGLLN
jgi:geranylgeranyl transferase type-2 subunit beta